MGLFDEITCKYPLPVEGANALAYQTKDTPEQYLDTYEIREDGTLWHEAVEREWRDDPNAFFKGALHRVSAKWEPCPMTGEVRFYAYKPVPGIHWIEWSAYFLEGAIQQLHLIRNDAVEPTP